MTEPAAETPAEPPAEKPAAPADTDPVVPSRDAGPAGVMDAVAIRQLWPSVLDAVKRGRRRTGALLHDVQVVAVEANLITLAAPSATLARMIGEDSNVEVMLAALRTEIGGDWRIAVRPEAASPGGPSPGSTPQTAVESDPREDTEFTAGEPPAGPVDPEADALDLLQSRLGARPVDG
jgi:DNA polymerase-3 subunit gamma/tau